MGDLLPWGARLIGRLAHGAAATTAAGIRGTGAEGLLGRGDFLAVLGGDVVRLQAAHSTAAEAARTAALLGECAAGARDAAPGDLALPEPGADSAPIDRRKIWKAGQGALRLLRSG